MIDGSRDKGGSENRSTDEAALSARLRHLGERLDQQRTSARPEIRPASTGDTSAMARGFRLSSEFVAGVLVGAALGWLLDRWLGISPWGLIVFLLLGFAAGVLNVMRAAGVSSGPVGGKRN
jgi:ATP synthase protein I